LGGRSFRHSLTEGSQATGFLETGICEVTDEIPDGWSASRREFGYFRIRRYSPSGEFFTTSQFSVIVLRHSSAGFFVDGSFQKVFLQERARRNRLLYLC
jgi:hypothetical protein